MKKGFTIIELLIFMGIFSIIIVFLTEILTSALDVKLESESVSSVEMDGRYILSRLMYDLNRAQQITTPAASGGSGSSLVIVIGGTSYTYDLNAGNLRLYDGSYNNLNSYNTSVSNFTVTHLGPGTPNEYYKDSARIGFTVTSRIIKTSGTEVKNFQTTVALR